MKKLAVLLSCAFASLAASGANLADFPRLDGETSDSPRLARAVASVPLGVLDIPEGRYEIDSTLNVANGASLRMEITAKFVAVKPENELERESDQLAYDADCSAYPERMKKTSFLVCLWRDFRHVAEIIVVIKPFLHF